MRSWLHLARVSSLAPLFVVAALCGCDGPPIVQMDGGHEDAPAAMGVLGLGEGELSYRAIDDGDTLLVAQGCQGSQHVWITLRSEGMDPRGMIIDLDLRRESDGAQISASFHLRLSFDQDVSGEFAQLSGITLQIPDPDMALDTDLILSGRIQDRDGVVAESSRRVRIAWGTERCTKLTG